MNDYSDTSNRAADEALVALRAATVREHSDFGEALQCLLSVVVMTMIRNGATGDTIAVALRTGNEWSVGPQPRER